MGKAPGSLGFVPIENGLGGPIASVPDQTEHALVEKLTVGRIALDDDDGVRPYLPNGRPKLPLVRPDLGNRRL